MPSTLKACLFKLSPESLAQLDALSKRIGGDRCSKTETIRRLIADRFNAGPAEPKKLMEVLTVDGSKLDGALSDLTGGAVSKVDDLTKICVKEPKKARTKIAKVEVAIHGPRSEEPALCLNGAPEYPMEPKTASTRSLVRAECKAVNKPGGKIL